MQQTSQNSNEKKLAHAVAAFLREPIVVKRRLVC
jgi:hypothetical protein